MNGRGLWEHRYLSLAVTALVLAALYAIACGLYDGFFSLRMAANLLGDNAFLGIVVVGMTLVIVSGGIDLSVGAVVGCSTMLIAVLIRAGVHPLLAMLIAVAAGAWLGGVQGGLIHHLRMPAFLVTLAGMFFARGMSYVISRESVAIRHSFYNAVPELGPVALLKKVGLLAQWRWDLPLTAVVLLAVFVLAIVAAHWTRFGRNIYALGGNEQSATLMGVPIGPTRVGVYTLSGALAALAGAVFTMYAPSGNPRHGEGLELDAIAVVVIGGTLLSGGRGYLMGSFLGLLLFGVIRAALDADGRLDSSWLRIAMGVLLLAFVLLQRLLAWRAR